jgi:hypothetical protein
MSSLTNAIPVKENDSLTIDINSRCESNHNNAFTNSLYIGYDHLSTATANLNKNSGSNNNLNEVKNEEKMDLHSKSQLLYNLE